MFRKRIFIKVSKIIHSDNVLGAIVKKMYYLEQFLNLVIFDSPEFSVLFKKSLTSMIEVIFYTS